MKKIFLALTLITFAMTSCSGYSPKRDVNTVNTTKSYLTIHKKRTITLYDYSGKEIKSWSYQGRCIVRNGMIRFYDEHGKLVAISGGIIINEEK